MGDSKAEFRPADRHNTHERKKKKKKKKIVFLPHTGSNNRSARVKGRRGQEGV